MVQIKATLLVILALTTVAFASPRFARDADSSSEESAETGEIMKELQELCRNNSGSDAAFVTLMESAQTTFTCFVGAIDLDAFMSDLYTLSNETRSTFFPRYCPQLRTAYKCTDQLLNDFRPCLEEDDFTIVQALSGIIPDAVDLMCKNEGEILFKLEEPKYADCVAKIGDNFNECINTFLNGTDDWDISHLNQDQCNTLTGFRQCVESKLSICKAPELISVYDLFHNTLFRMTPCRNYVDVPKVVVLDNNELNEV
ncbi:AGAP006275-PA [Anopheles gambiae str. PEST]|uniref:AGAP006275-PA n=2 Tax=gambiae species complex TaxID=44542 RepID=Q7Q5Q0_ANOGA|nr:AGAP006275-PA [Anopheles gambiae str. PEST]